MVKTGLLWASVLIGTTLMARLIGVYDCRFQPRRGMVRLIGTVLFSRSTGLDDPTEPLILFIYLSAGHYSNSSSPKSSAH